MFPCWLDVRNRYFLHNALTFVLDAIERAWVGTFRKPSYPRTRPSHTRKNAFAFRRTRGVIAQVAIRPTRFKAALNFCDVNEPRDAMR